ncbi:hypothetical protein [Streptosporangium vulgare]|uniref:hypothetical protein n=1 Tax=Streptosporangium vulgare TaxID=46190 RepID=UPI0031D22A20
MIAKVARAESEALADTAAQLNPDRLGMVVEAVAGARKVAVYGVGALRAGWRPTWRRS